MGEVIGLAASLIALGGVAVTAAKVSIIMVEIANDVKWARDDILMFGYASKSFASLLKLSRDELHHQFNNPNLSPVVRRIKDSNVMGDLVRQAKLLKERIKELTPKIKGLPSSIGIVTTLKWTFQKSRVLALAPHMKGIETSLNLIMAIVKLEQVQQVAPSDQALRTMESLKQQIVDLMKMVEIVCHLQLSDLGSRSHSIQPQNIYRAEVLLRLGESMVDGRPVPAPATNLSATHTSMHGNRELHLPVRQQASRRVYDSAISMVAESPMDSRYSNQYLTLSDVSSSQLSNTTSQDNREVSLQPPASVLSSIPVDRGSSRRESTSNTTSSSSYLRHRETHNSVNARLRHHRQESDFISVKPTSSIIHVGPPPHSPNFEGDIDIPSGVKHVKILLGKNIEGNVMPQAYAERCGLQVESLGEGEEDTWVEFGKSQRKKCIGAATVQWRIGERSFPVRCFVCKGGVRGLVFGKPFIEKDKSYQNSGNVSDGVS